MDAAMTTPNVAEVADRLRRYFVLGMLLLGQVNAAQAGEELLEGTAAQVAEILSIGGVAGMLYFLGRVMVWKLRNRSLRLRDPYCDDDGFYAHALTRAHTASWAVTFVFLALTDLFAGLGGLDGFVLVHITIAVMMTSFGTAFLWLGRDRGASDPENAPA